MASTRRHRIEACRFEELSAGLEDFALAEPDLLSRRQMLAKLWNSISSALTQGRSIADIHDHLRKADPVFACSMETFRRDLKAIEKDEAKKTRNARMKRRGETHLKHQETAKEVAVSEHAEATEAAVPVSTACRAEQTDKSPPPVQMASDPTKREVTKAGEPALSDPRGPRQHDPVQADMFSASVTPPSGRETNASSRCVAIHGEEK